MPLLRLAYTTQFLIALIAVFFVWEEVGGPYHLDLMPWWLKLSLGTGVAFAIVRATASAVSNASTWNKGTSKWCAAMVVLALCCAVANYYCNLYGEESDEQEEQNTSIAAFERRDATLGTHAKISLGGSFELRHARLCMGAGRPQPDRAHRRGAVNG